MNMVRLRGGSSERAGSGSRSAAKKIASVDYSYVPILALNTTSFDGRMSGKMKVVQGASYYGF
jgi:hypothetical protein